MPKKKNVLQEALERAHLARLTFDADILQALIAMTNKLTPKQRNDVIILLRGEFAKMPKVPEEPTTEEFDSFIVGVLSNQDPIVIRFYGLCKNYTNIPRLDPGRINRVLHSFKL